MSEPTEVPVHATGPDPKNATATVSLNWGMVAIPLNIYAGSSDGIKVECHEYTPDGHRVGRALRDAQTNEPLDAATPIVKRANTSSGGTVEVTDAELAEATTVPQHNGANVIEALIPLSAIGSTYQVVSNQQARPAPLELNKHKVPNLAAEKAFALLCTVLAEQQAAALFRMRLARGPARYGALCPDGRLVMLAWAEQVRPALPMPAGGWSDSELDMARMLCTQIGVSTPVLNDVASAEMQAYVDAKAGAQPLEAVAGPVPTAAGDLMAALAASIEQAAPARKPRKPRARKPAVKAVA